MNPRLTPETAAMREMVLAFAGRDLPPAGDGPFDAGEFRRRWGLAGKQGLTGATVPPSTAGAGWTPSPPPS